MINTNVRIGSKVQLFGFYSLGYANSDTTPIDTIKGSVGEWRDGFFALDNWQVAPKFTINYGFRYDLPTAPYSLNGYGRLLNDAQTALMPATTATSSSVGPQPNSGMPSRA